MAAGHETKERLKLNKAMAAPDNSKEPARRRLLSILDRNRGTVRSDLTGKAICGIDLRHASVALEMNFRQSLAIVFGVAGRPQSPALLSHSLHK